MRFLIALFTCFCTPLAAADEEAMYARPELLVEVGELQLHLAELKSLSERPLTLLDVRPEQDYRKWTIPGARHVDVAEWKEAFGDGTDAEGWSKRIGGVLRDADSTVVVFDDAISGNGARVWWILKYWGVEDARILNGGVSAWTEAKGEVVEIVPPATTRQAAPPVQFEAIAQPERLATTEEVRELSAESDGATCLIDTRTDDECARGVIPTSNHLDWQELVDADTGLLRPAAELQVLLERVGFDPEQPTVTYCQSGGRASVMAFAVELMGGEEVANYYGSWGEWSQQ